VPRLWASLAIDQLERGGRGEDRARVVALSQGYGVMSRQTSLLVLESQAMFDAFGVDRGQSTATWTGEDAIDEATASGAIAQAQAEQARDGAQPSGVGFALADLDGEAGGGVATRARRAALEKSMGAGVIDDLSGMDEPVTTKTTDTAVPAKATPPAATDGKGAKGATRRKESVARPDPTTMRGRGFVPMRRVWYRVAAIGDATGPTPTIQAAVEAARTALTAQPDSRERHRALVQALAFADGGLSALGTNVTLMGLVAVWGGYAVFLLARAILPKRVASVPIAAAVSAFVSVPLTALAFAFLFSVGGQAPIEFSTLAATMVGWHTLIGLGEGAITFLAVGAITATRPDLVFGAHGLLTARELEIRTAASV